MTVDRHVNQHNHDVVYARTDFYADNSDETVFVMVSADQFAGAPEHNFAHIIMSSSRAGTGSIVAVIRDRQRIQDMITVLQTALAADVVRMPTSDDWRQLWSVKGEHLVDRTDVGSEIPGIHLVERMLAVTETAQ